MNENKNETKDKREIVYDTKEGNTVKMEVSTEITYLLSLFTCFSSFFKSFSFVFKKKNAK